MKKIFYSWQADRSKTTGRNLVHKALEDAIKMLPAEADTSVEEAERDQYLVELDSDTQGVAGSPPIVETIFGKIDAASVFVADLTFVGERCGGRMTPNPNVAIEYGYALKALSHSKIVGVMNEAHGKPTRESLPFDLGHMRFPITYECSDEADEATRKKARASLAAKLKPALKAILGSGESSLEVERPLYASLYPSPDEPRFRIVGAAVGMYHDGSPIPRDDARQIGIALGPAMWLRLMPKYAPASDLLVTKLREALINSGRVVTPLHAEDAMNMWGIRGDDGYGFAANLSGDNATIMVYVLKRGEVWSIDAARMGYEPGKVFFNPKEYVRSLTNFGYLLGRLGIAGPYRWIAGIDGMKGRGIYIEGRASAFDPQICLQHSVICEGDYSGEAQEAVTAIEPFIARVFDAAHLQR